MGRIDPEKERQRLAEWYAESSDGKLEKIGREPAALTEWAGQALQAEMTKRGLEWKYEVPDKPAEKPEPELVVIKKFRDLPEATIARSMLESAGIECFLHDDNLVRLDWFISNALGGIKLLVREDDVEAARELLEQKVLEKFDVEGVGEYEQPRCPQCKSYEVSQDGLAKRISYTGLFVGLPIPVTHKGWMCHACGYAWGENDGSDEAEGRP